MARLISFLKCSDGNQQGHLFEHHGLFLGLHLHGTSAPVGKQSLDRKLTLISDSDRSPEGCIQAELDFGKKPEPLISFVPTSRLAYLDYTVADLLKQSFSGRNLPGILRRLGITYIGELVQKSQRTLTSQLRLTDSEVGAIEARLSEGGLYLGMNVPYWRHPCLRFGKVK